MRNSVVHSFVSLVVKMHILPLLLSTFISMESRKSLLHLNSTTWLNNNNNNITDTSSNTTPTTNGLNDRNVSLNGSRLEPYTWEDKASSPKTYLPQRKKPSRHAIMIKREKNRPPRESSKHRNKEAVVNSTTTPDSRETTEKRLDNEPEVVDGKGSSELSKRHNRPFRYNNDNNNLTKREHRNNGKIGGLIKNGGKDSAGLLDEITSKSVTIKKVSKDKKSSFQKMTSRGKETTSRGKETTSRGKETTSRGKETMSRGKETTSRGKDMTSRGKDMTSRGKDTTTESRRKNRPHRKHHNRNRYNKIHRYKSKNRSRARNRNLKTTIKSDNHMSENSETKSNGQKSSNATSNSSHNGSDDAANDCPTCWLNKLPEETVREIRLNMFVEKMAEKLRVSPKELMSRKGSKNAPVLPRDIIEETLQDNAMEDSSDGFYAWDQKVILPGNDLGRNCIAKRTSGCFKFEMAGKIQGGVASAELWVYKTPDRNDSSGIQTFILYGLETLRSGRVLASNQLQRHDTMVREGWVVINMTRTVTSWVQERKGVEMIAIRCASCDTRNHKALYGAKHGHKPLLIIKYDTTSIRSKRSYHNCNPVYECCKRQLDVNFRDLHMINIEAPPDLAVGYCHGSCEANRRQHAYNHTRLKDTFRLVSEDTSHALREQLKPCCVPVVLKSASVIVRRGRESYRTLMPNIVVERCGCV